MANPGPSWHAEGAGDFNGDGKADILWQNSAARGDLADERHRFMEAGLWRTLDRTGTSRAPATSTATATPTFSGRTETARPRSG